MRRKQLRRTNATTTHGKPVSSNNGCGHVAGAFPGTTGSCWWNWLGWCCLIAGAIFFGILHRNHVNFIHESERHFSHLSTLERELLFRTEMGFYYSYFKQVVEAPTLQAGLTTLLVDNITEYPDTINALKRFNLYPEVALGVLYRGFRWVAAVLGWRTVECYFVHRGANIPKVESCEGLGDLTYFYVEGVFALSGVLMAAVFLLGAEIGDSWLGGVLAVAAYFFNHRECTRVQWTPPLRESFSFPFFMLQQYLLITLIRRPLQTTRLDRALLTAATVAFMLPWQFAQFALLTQSLSLFVAHMVGYLPARFFRFIAHSLLLALGLSWALQCGNGMLLTSYYCAALITMIGLAHAERCFHSLGHPLLAWAAQVLCLAGGTYCVKAANSYIVGVADDAHISEILLSKFTSFKNFNTMLYTCAPEFDFMQIDSLWQLSYTLLLPAALLASVLAFVRLLVDAYHKMRSVVVFEASARSGSTVANGSPDSGVPGAEVDDFQQQQQQKMELLCLRGADVVFLLCQLCAFTVMAVLIMRLKLFWTPQLCITCALLARPGWLRIRSFAQHALLVLLLAGMAVKGWQNLQVQRPKSDARVTMSDRQFAGNHTEWSSRGEFSNWPLEQLVYWVRENTRPGDSFAGTMPTMATLRLTTGRPIVNHPHYEDEGLRRRTKIIYSMYSRRSVEDIWRAYRQLDVRYTVVEPGWCYRSTKPGCSLPELWDLEEPDRRGLRAFCERLLQGGSSAGEPYFRKVFDNEDYRVYKVWPGGARDTSVRSDPS